MTLQAIINLNKIFWRMTNVQYSMVMLRCGVKVKG
jgi:hypothetical protein